MELKACIFIAEEITFDPYRKSHSVKHVLNIIEVPLLPSAVVTDVLIKMILPSDNFEESASIQVIAPDHISVFSSPVLEIKNYRSPEAVPGMDAHVQIRFAATEEGNYLYKFLVNDKVIAVHPIYIRLSGVRA